MSHAVPDTHAVLIVDDHPVVRRGMVAMLATESWIGQVAEAGTAGEARRLATTSCPDIAIVDLTLPDGDGVSLIRDLSKAVPGCAVVVMTMTNDPGSVRAALDAGARGYLHKDAAPEVLIAALRTVAAGGQVLGPGVTSDPSTGGPPPPFDVLTPRELQLVMLLAAGQSNHQIARSLSLSEKTVRNQVSSITAKLGVADRVQAALLAHRAGLAGTDLK